MATHNGITFEIDNGFEVAFEYDDISEQEYAQRRLAAMRERKALYNQGLVGVTRRGDVLVLTYHDETAEYRGSSVDGCGADDEFVQSLARDFKTRVDASR
jgi:hypothetical protein